MRRKRMIAGIFKIVLVCLILVSILESYAVQKADAAPSLAIDNKLADDIDKYAPDYYHDFWGMSLSQYKSWIALITLREAGYGRYAAHSQYGGGYDGDRFNHIDVGDKFRFSTGIGAFQLDRYGNQGDAKENWGMMPTIEKIDPEISLLSVLRWHRDRFGDSAKWNGATLSDFSKYSAWNAVRPNKESDFISTWKDITDCEWSECNSAKVEVNFHPPVVDDPFENNVKYIGKVYWPLEGWKEYFDTWLITPRDWSGNVVVDGGYYYAKNTTGWEMWVWNDTNHKYIYRFARNYTAGEFPEGRKDIGTSVAVAGTTDTSPALDPNNVLPVASLIFSPENPVVDEEVTFDASASYDPAGGSIANYRWEFYRLTDYVPFPLVGLIEGANKKIVKFSFPSEGFYFVRLIVTDDDGQTNSIDKSITVTAPTPISEGLQWLRTHQNPDGSWSGSVGENVGYTALGALAFLNYGVHESDPTVSKAIGYIRSNIKKDGSIYVSYSNYETSLAILPLVATHNSSYDVNITAARNFLVNIQNDETEGLTTSNWQYGGWGYQGNSPTWSDLSNTQWDLMGLDAANLLKSSNTWSKAELYVNRSQNWHATNPLYDVTNDGGFTYQPPSISCCWGSGGNPKQSYGAMTAAGVGGLRLIGVNTGDPRVQAGLNWLKSHYAPIDTVKNPGIGGEFLYYYLLGFSKALIMTGIPPESWQETASNDITNYIVNKQNDDGHWTSYGNEEDDLLATEEAILTLETRTIPTDIKRLSFFTFILHSNADLHIYDPLGRHVGKNYETGGIDIQIPNATYTSDGEQNITVPDLESGNYRIVLIGTGNGEYNLDVIGGVGNDIVSQSSYTSSISEGETQESTVNVAMLTGLSIHVSTPEPTNTMVQSATGTGNVSFTSDAGTIENLTAINESDLPTAGKPNIKFPHGFFAFNVTGLNPGQTVNVTIAFPSNISTSAQYWKYNASGGWYQIAVGSNDGDNVLTIQLKDGGIGDDDGVVNGIIADAGGVGVPPPEALIKFDPLAKDIKVYNNETGSEANYIILPFKMDIDGKEMSNENIDKGWEPSKELELRQYTLKDLAGNSLVLVLEHKKDANEPKIKLISMQYNSGKVLLAAKNQMKADYSAEKNGMLKELEQDIEVKKQFTVDAAYSANKNKTEITVKIEGQKDKKETKKGIVILELLTNKGDLKYRY